MKFAINAPVLIQVVTLRWAVLSSVGRPGRRERLIQGEISPTPKAIIKEIAFNGRPNYSPCQRRNRV